MRRAVETMPLPRTKWQQWLERRDACIRGRRWVGHKSAAATWRDLESASDMSWLIWKLTQDNCEFFSQDGAEFLTNLAHRVDCDAVRAMCPTLPEFKFGQFLGWTKAQRTFLGRLAKPLPTPATMPGAQT